MIILGFGYRAKHGKDTCVKNIIDAKGSEYKIVRLAFGDFLKVEVYDALCLLSDPFWDWAHAAGQKFSFLSLPHPDRFLPCVSREEKLAWIEQNKDALRSVLQIYGTEYRRSQNAIYWAVQGAKELKRLEKEGVQVVLVSDVRFPSEAIMLKSLKATLINVVRSGYEDPQAGNHISEIALENWPWDYTITVEEGQLDILREDALYVFNTVIDKHNVVVDAEAISKGE